MTSTTNSSGSEKPRRRRRGWDSSVCMDSVRLQTKIGGFLIGFSKNRPYIFVSKYFIIKLLARNNLYEFLSLVSTLFCSVHNSGKPSQEMMAVRGIATMKKDLDTEIQDIMIHCEIWDYWYVAAKKFLKPIASIRRHTRYNLIDSANEPKKHDDGSVK